jgi:CBS domain-containing protein
MSRRLVSDIMSSQVHSLPGSATVLEAACLMSECRIGAVAVVEEGRLEGIFTERDALCRVVVAGHDPGKTPLRDVMTADPETAIPQMTAVAALLRMRDGGFRHLPVVEDGQVKGIISMRDFIGAEFHEVEDRLEFAQLLEADLE